MTLFPIHTHKERESLYAYDHYFQHLYQMVTHSGTSLHRWWYFPLRSPISSALWLPNIWFHRTPYTCLCLIKLWPWTLRSFPLFAIFFCLFTGWWKLGQKTSREVKATEQHKVRFSITSRSNSTEDQQVIKRWRCQATIQPESSQYQLEVSVCEWRKLWQTEHTNEQLFQNTYAILALVFLQTVR